MSICQNGCSNAEISVSIIIVSYNTRELTMQCLNSIFEKTEYIDFQVVVVDNNSIDGTQQEIKANFPQVLLIESPENIGFGRANNIGMKYAEGKYLLFLNSDTLLLNNAVKIFFDFIEEHLDLRIGAVGCVLVDGNHQMIHSSGPFPRKFETIKSTVLGYFSDRYWKKIQRNEMNQYETHKTFFEVDYVTGADLFVNGNLMRKFEGFDPSFFMYYEESELQLRMYKQGYKNYIIHGPSIVHMICGSSKKSESTMEKKINNAKSFIYFFKKHSNYFDYCIFRLFYLMARLPVLFDRRVSLSERFRYLYFLFTE